MNWPFKDSLPLLALCLCAALTPQRALAQIAEQTPISFGKIAILSVNNAGRLTLHPGGAYDTNSYLAVIDPPVQGEYLVTGPASTAYTVTVSPSVNLNGPGGAFFTLDNFVVQPVTLVTNAAGEDTFYLTGRLQTQGGGMTYLDGSYNGVVTLTVAF